MKTFELIDFVRLLSAGLNYAAIYDVEHVRAIGAARAFHALFVMHIDADHEDGIFLGVVDHRVVWDGHPVLGATVVGRRLVQTTTRLNIGGFLFHRGLEEAEVVRFLQFCNSRETAEGVSDVRQKMLALGLRNVSPSPRYGEVGWLGDQWGEIHGGRICSVADGEDGVATADALQCYFRLVAAVEDMHAAAHHDRAPDDASARDAAHDMVRVMGQDAASLMHLSRYPDFESYTIGHSVRVALFCVLVGQRIGLVQEDLFALATAALLHDVGKGRIPHEILYKPGALTNEEREVMATHTTLGAEILLRSHAADLKSISAALCHHLRSDGDGYPRAPVWARRSWSSQLIQTCDVFEALTAVRPYKPAMSPQRAYEIMIKDASAFEPGCMSALFRATGFYPPGVRVVLDTGVEASVCRVTSDPQRPVVKLLTDAGKGDELDLRAEFEGVRYEIAEIVPEARVAAADASSEVGISVGSFDCGHELQHPLPCAPSSE